jgi:hypothetical protein
MKGYYGLWHRAERSLEPRQSDTSGGRDLSLRQAPRMAWEGRRRILFLSGHSIVAHAKLPSPQENAPTTSRPGSSLHSAKDLHSTGMRAGHADRCRGRRLPPPCHLINTQTTPALRRHQRLCHCTQRATPLQATRGQLGRFARETTPRWTRRITFAFPSGTSPAAPPLKPGPPPRVLPQQIKPSRK